MNVASHISIAYHQILENKGQPKFLPPYMIYRVKQWEEI